MRGETGMEYGKMGAVLSAVLMATLLLGCESLPVQEGQRTHRERRDVSLTTLELQRQELCAFKHCPHLSAPDLQDCVRDHCDIEPSSNQQQDYAYDDSKQGADWLKDLLASPNWSVQKRGQEDVEYGAPGQKEEGESTGDSLEQTTACLRKCMAFSGEQMKECAYWRCFGVSQVRKRWSNRVCMEHRCKEFVDTKDSYFQCGRSYCDM